MASTCLYGGRWIEHGVEWWSNWMYRIVTLLSLASHLILAVFADIRRRKRRGLRRGLVWVAYQLTDLAPAYVMSNLYIETSRREKMIFAFWVPFLLLHNARPDSISAYSMEDSGLVSLVALFQTLGSIYLMYRYILVDCIFTGSLLWASCIMMFLCIFKYAESAVALRRADLSNIWSSFKQRQQHPSSFGEDYGGHWEPEPDDEKVLLVAHDLFDICKGAFCDYLVDLDRHKTGISLFKSADWKIMCKVVQMELSLMYDILYTKAAVVHTWGGYAIRMLSPPLTAIALLLFGLHHKEGMPTEDEAISYVLLSLTLLLDVKWLFRTLASAWTRSFLKRMPNIWLKHEFRESWEKLRRFVVSPRLSRVSLCLRTCESAEEPKSYRRWAGSLGQRNFLNSCTQGPFNTLYRNLLDNCTRGGGTLYSSSSVLRELSIKASVLLGRYRRSVTRSPPPAEQADRLGPGTSEQQPDHPPEFQEDVFIWHIATDVYLRCNTQVTATVTQRFPHHKKAIEMISDYMMFLDIGKHDMLPGRKFHSVIETACRIIGMAAKPQYRASSSKTKGDELAKWMLTNKDNLKTLGATGEGTGGINKGHLADRARICLSEGTQIAHELHHRRTATEEGGLVAIRRHAHWIPNMLHPPGPGSGHIERTLEFILDVWVNMLDDASLRCSRESHAKQLSRGGELITIIWVATQHADADCIKSRFCASFF
ncbi:uncharacterized protein LOC119312048 [Triticum dicoccoides]|uniref:uncharacterized protein LOC119312048 n=1 Tax=Triticum dicoccoides TaxID=85692 RepID=UPI000E7A2A84|nr:uncharacterized protein LOC119312048 [Triticum dicoccoides]